MEKQGKFEEFKTSAKEAYEKAKSGIRWKAAKAGKWIVDNKDIVIVFVPITVAGLRAGQSLIVNKRLKDERTRMDKSYYDRSTNLRWQLKRKPTNAENEIIDRKKKEGIDTADILKSLRLI